MPLDFSLESLPVAADGKSNRHGKAAILDPTTLEQLFQILGDERDRALFGLCYFTSSRISEALKLKQSDIASGIVTFRSCNTKTKTTRRAELHPTAVALLEEYQGNRGEGTRQRRAKREEYLFPGRWGRGHLTRQGADKILREACGAIGLEGVSTHSFRRSFVTQMVSEGKTPSQIQQYTGHKNLASLMHYFGA